MNRGTNTLLDRLQTSNIATFVDKHHQSIFLLWIVLCALGILITPVVAIPTTGAATLVGSNNATLAATGGGVDCWFTYGTNSGNHYWITPNTTAAAGVFSQRIHSAPLTGNTLWYYAACDETGCDAEQSFFTLPVTPLHQTNMGGFYRNITQSGFNIPNMAANLIGPYVWNTNIPLVIVFLLIFMPVFVGIWLRSRSAIMVMITGFITGSFILYADRGLQLGIPPEVTQVAQALCYVAFAGAVIYILKR